MTVSTINGVQAELRRVQETQNKPGQALQFQPSAATLPEDVINVPVQTGPDLAAAVAATELQNRAAAESVLTEADIQSLEASSGVATEKVQAAADAALAAQTNKLPAKILDLLSE